MPPGVRGVQRGDAARWRVPGHSQATSAACGKMLRRRGVMEVAMPQLTIVGMGLIGTSLGLAVRQSKLGYQVVGHDLHHEATGKARKLGAVDRAEWNLPAAVEAADLVVVATPVLAVEQVF